MIANPYDTIPFKEAAWAEGFCKGIASVVAPAPSDSVAEEDFDAFNDGVATGADAASNGIALDMSCVAAQEGSPGHDATMVFEGLDWLHGAWEARHLVKLGGIFAASVLTVILVAVSAKNALPAEQVLPGYGNAVTDKLTALGAGSMEIFCGVDLDILSEDCTMFMSALFLSMEQARDAAVANARADGWIVVSWRTDQSNSFRIVTSNQVE